MVLHTQHTKKTQIFADTIESKLTLNVVSYLTEVNDSIHTIIKNQNPSRLFLKLWVRKKTLSNSWPIAKPRKMTQSQI